MSDTTAAVDSKDCVGKTRMRATFTTRDGDSVGALCAYVKKR